MELLVPNFQMMTASSHLGPRARVVLLRCSPLRLTLQVRERKQKGDLVLPAIPSHTPSARRTEAAHVWFHRDGTMQTRCTLGPWSGAAHPDGGTPGVSEKAWTTSPRLFRASQQFNSAAQTYRCPLPSFSPSCPAVPASPGRASSRPCPAPTSPGTYALGSDPHTTKHNGWLANTPPSSNPPHKREHGNSTLSVRSQSCSVSGQRLRQLVGAFLLAKGLLPNSELNQEKIPTQRKPEQAQAQQFCALVVAGQISSPAGGFWQTSLPAAPAPC